MILFVNACVRKESRTEILARALLKKLNLPYNELNLSDVNFPTVDESFLTFRDQAIQRGDFDNPAFCLARQFSKADIIVIAAPYWDMSFPASLKRYIEQINVLGVTFRYDADGVPQGLCKAKKLFYVTTAGGTYVPTDYGYGYIKSLADNFYGIPDVRLISATGLDMFDADPEKIIEEAVKNINDTI